MEAGFRPSNSLGEKMTAATLEATTEHIKDLRSGRDFMRRCQIEFGHPRVFDASKTMSCAAKYGSEDAHK